MAVSYNSVFIGDDERVSAVVDINEPQYPVLLRFGQVGSLNVHMSIESLDRLQDAILAALEEAKNAELQRTE